MSVNEKMKAIADAIREKTNITEPLTLDAMAENIPFVYSHGYAAGNNDGFASGTEHGKMIGYEEGFISGETSGRIAGLEEGKQAEYDAFWDAYQDYGNRKSYQYAFAGTGWNNVTLKPKYTITITASNATSMFVRCNCYGKTRLDMTEICKKLDTSNLTSAALMFQDAFLENVTVDLGNATTLNNCFSSGNVGANKSIRNVTLKVTEKCTSLSSAFAYCDATEEVIFTDDSTIAADGLNFRWSTKLNKASIKSIINALSDEKEGLTVTLSQIAVDTAFETVKDAADGSTSAEWIALAGDENTEGIRPKWNISLL